MRKTILIFRHGETDWNKAGRMQGGTDIPLNETGRAQAQQLRAIFERHPVEVFLTSDLQRAHETARIAAGSGGARIIVDPRLRETNLGDVEGLTAEEIIERFGADALESWRSSTSTNMQFRFPNGESKSEHLARLLKGLEDFLHTTPFTKIGVASHGGAMRRLIHHFRPDLENMVSVGNCVVYRVHYDVANRLWDARECHEPFKG